MNDVPETLRSAGVPPRPAPPPPPARRLAWATYEVLRRGEAFVSITYLDDPEAFTMFTVRAGNGSLTANGIDPLYEAAYLDASRAARAHGYELERFSRSEERQRRP